jgi:hypothetical protein
VTEAALLVSDYRLIVIIDGNLDYSAINQYKCSLAGYYSAVRQLFYTEGLFRLQISVILATVALSFVFGNYCPIVD